VTRVGVSQSDIAVVGGGVIGAACARAAALRGLHVTLFAPGPDPAAASRASAGLLAAQIESGDERLLPLAVRGRDLYQDLAASLKDTTGTDIGFQPIGIATFAFDETQAAALFELVAEQRQAGLRCDWLERDDLNERWPGVAPEARGALYAPEDGCLDPAALAAALLADARRLGVRISPEPVRRILTSQGRAMGVATAANSIPAPQIVIAAGAWSPLLEGLPRRLAVEPVRGQLLAIDWPAGFPAAVFYHGHGYLLPRGSEAILGSTMEHVGFDAHTTEAGLAEIRHSTARLCPAITQSAVRRSWAGLRPVTPDGLPILGADPEISGVWYATGHGRNGILLAGITGEIIGDLLSSGHTDVDISELSIDRFTQDQPMADSR
jgi:glycine oxidase